MLSLAGIPLMLEDPENDIYSFVEKHINPENYHPWTRRVYPGPGLAALSLPTGYITERPFRINKFIWPAWGASRWAYGHFLADAEQVYEIRDKAFGASGNQTDKIELLMSTPGANSEESLSTDVYLLPPTPLSSVPIDSENHTINNLYLLTVVDERFYWWNESTPKLEFTDNSTWTEAFDIAKDALGIEIDVDEIHADYLNPSPQLNLSYEAIPPWLDALCFNVGHRFVCRFNGTYLTQDYASALRSRNDDIGAHPDRLVLAGGQRFKDTIR